MSYDDGDMAFMLRGDTPDKAPERSRFVPALEVRDLSALGDLATRRKLLVQVLAGKAAMRFAGIMTNPMADGRAIPVDVKAIERDVRRMPGRVVDELLSHHVGSNAPRHVW